MSVSSCQNLQGGGLRLGVREPIREEMVRYLADSIRRRGQVAARTYPASEVAEAMAILDEENTAIWRNPLLDQPR
jgi:hypothetical protein